MDTPKGLIETLQTGQDELMKKYLELYRLSPGIDSVNNFNYEIVELSANTIQRAYTDGLDDMPGFIRVIQYCTIMTAYHFKEISGFNL